MKMQSVHPELPGEPLASLRGVVQAALFAAALAVAFALVQLAWFPAPTAAEDDGAAPASAHAERVDFANAPSGTLGTAP